MKRNAGSARKRQQAIAAGVCASKQRWKTARHWLADGAHCGLRCEASRKKRAELGKSASSERDNAAQAGAGWQWLAVTQATWPEERQ